MTVRTADSQIAANIAVHDRVAERYDKGHGEIFNEIEQARLRQALQRMRDSVRTGEEPLKALDFGCGSGNLTRHLLELGFHVTAADVSRKFLELVARRFAGAPLTIHQLNGTDLRELPDDNFDAVAVYSVLHHVPDYLGAVRELGRICKPGGVIMLDHEPTEAHWNDDPILLKYRAAAKPFDWRRFLVPSNYVHKVRRLFNPRHTNEGDIHVWKDDHVEWDKVEAALKALGIGTVSTVDYLLYRRGYKLASYEGYKNQCHDMRCMIFRKETVSTAY